MDQLNEIVERLRYAIVPFSELEVKSADDFELKENMIVHWNDRYSSSRAVSSGVVVSSFAVQDSLQGPVVMIYDGEMCFLSNPSELFATESGIYGFIAKKIERGLLDEQARIQHFRKLAEETKSHNPVFSGPIIDWMATSASNQMTSSSKSSANVRGTLDS